MVDPEKMLDLWTRGDWQFVLRDILLRDRGVGFEVYMYINIRYFSHKRTGQTYTLSFHFSKELPGTCLLRDFVFWFVAVSCRINKNNPLTIPFFFKTTMKINASENFFNNTVHLIHG